MILRADENVGIGTNTPAEEAWSTLNKLKPVTFIYKADVSHETHAGFIAEDAPELAASADRKGVNPMDIVAVLTKVVQEQQKRIAALEERIKALEERQ